MEQQKPQEPSVHGKKVNTAVQVSKRASFFYIFHLLCFWQKKITKFVGSTTLNQPVISTVCIFFSESLLSLWDHITNLCIQRKHLFLDTQHLGNTIDNVLPLLHWRLSIKLLGTLPFSFQLLHRSIEAC